MVYTVYMKGSNLPSTILVSGRRILENNGPDSVTMRRIAKAVGVTPMAIYRHYRDRDSVLNAIADQGFKDLSARLQKMSCVGTSEAKLMRMGDLYLDHALENPHMFELMFLYPRFGARRYPQDFEAGASPTANLMAAVVRDGIKSGHFRQDNVWEIVFELGALSHGLIMLYLGGRLAPHQHRFRALYRRSFRRYIRGISR
jgi:AcrR family transcriptional regulator